MTSVVTSPSLKRDLKLLSARAYHAIRWTEPVLREYHTARRSLRGEDADRLLKLHDWILVPLTLWPLEMCDLMRDALARLRSHERLSQRQQLVIDLLPEPPDAAACEIVARHEHQVQSGAYENLLGNASKFAQMEDELKANPGFQSHWTRIKAAFRVDRFADGKGVLRRTMGTERNLRPEWPNRKRGAHATFQAAFDAFCLRWNLYGMQHDEPLLLKLAVNLTAFATMIVVPAYWSLDPKRDIRWNEIARLHRARARNRQGAALKEGREQRREMARRLKQLDAEAAKRGLRGDARHAFLVAELGLSPGTSDRTIRRLRQESRAGE